MSKKTVLTPAGSPWDQSSDDDSDGIERLGIWSTKVNGRKNYNNQRYFIVVICTVYTLSICSLMVVITELSQRKFYELITSFPAPACTIYACFGNSDITWTWIPWSRWYPLLSSVDLTTAMLFSVCTGYLNQPSAPCNECRTLLLGLHLVCHHAIMSVRRWRSCTGC